MVGAKAGGGFAARGGIGAKAKIKRKPFVKPKVGKLPENGKIVQTKRKRVKAPKPKFDKKLYLRAGLPGKRASSFGFADGSILDQIKSLFTRTAKTKKLKPIDIRTTPESKKKEDYQARLDRQYNNKVSNKVRPYYPQGKSKILAAIRADKARKKPKPFVPALTEEEGTKIKPYRNSPFNLPKPRKPKPILPYGKDKVVYNSEYK